MTRTELFNVNNILNIAKNKSTAVLTMCCMLIAVSLHAQQYKTHYVVAQDSSGDYTSIQAVINVCKAFPDERITIEVKPGTYKEKVEIYSWNTKISLIGQSAANTIITYDDYSGKGNINTFTSYTVKVMANDFYAENITFENSAGPVGQAVALHVEGDRCVFRNCRFLGNQDTMYAAGQDARQYFVDCYIEGTTDFIFGAATALFENCEIHSLRNSYVTAASTVQGQQFGYVFKGCKLTAANGVDKVYLGRPWRSYARTVFIDCELGAHILPGGWDNWRDPAREKTTFYGEYNSEGPGAAPSKRVAWSHQLSAKQVRDYTVEKIFSKTDLSAYEVNWYQRKK